MILREILKKIRQIEIRTNRIVGEFGVGARTSARFTARTSAASTTNPALNSIRALKRRERRAPVCQNSKPLEFEGFRNYGEFAMAGKVPPILIPSNSTESSFQASASWMLNHNSLEFIGVWEQIHSPNFKGLESETFRNRASISP